jgi:lysophospholipase L1-like esterase
VAAGDGDLVVVSFTGNSLTPCMSDGAGGHLRGDALVAKYEADLGALVEGIRKLGAEVLLVGQPERGPNADGIEEVRGINTVYEALAEEDGVALVDAGAAVETDDGAFTADLPCLPEEQECGPSGRNVVRNPDGVHLCPERDQVQCPVYSSGAFRFAGAIADAIKSR